MRWWRRLVLALMLNLVATPALALCEAYDKPLDKSQLEGLVDQVRDAFPARYRATLDKVEVQVTAERGFSPYLVQEGELATLTAPASMLREYCSIAQWGFYARNMSPEERKQLTGELWNLCDRQTDPQLCRIMAGEAIVATVDGTLRDNRQYQNTKYIIDQLQRSAVAFALAHELAHALIDGHPDFRRRSRDFDAEFEADTLAFSIFSTGMVWPGSQSFLFQAIATVSSGNLKPDSTDSPHEALLCRLARAEALQNQLGENLGKLFLWRGQRESLQFQSPLTQTGTIFSITGKEPSSACNLAASDAAKAIGHDLAQLVAIAESSGPEARGQRAPLRLLAAAKMKTRFGRTMRNGMIASALSNPLLSTYNMALTGEVRADLPNRMRAINSQFGLVADPLDFSARDYRNMLGARAFEAFLSRPSGSSLSTNLIGLEAELAKGRAYARDGLTDQLLLAAKVVVGGNCHGNPNELLGSIMQSLMTPLLDSMRISAFAGDTSVDVDAIEKQFGSLIEAAPKGPEKGQTEKCKANAKVRMTSYKQVFGWID